MPCQVCMDEGDAYFENDGYRERAFRSYQRHVRKIGVGGSLPWKGTPPIISDRV